MSSKVSDARLDKLIADVESEYIVDNGSEWSEERKLYKADHLAALRELRALRSLPDGVPRTADDVSLLARLEAFSEPYANVDVIAMRAAMLEARDRLDDLLAAADAILAGESQ